MVTIFTASLTFSNSTFCPYSNNWLLCITETVRVYCAVRPESHERIIWKPQNWALAFNLAYFTHRSLSTTQWAAVSHNRRIQAPMHTQIFLSVCTHALRSASLFWHTLYMIRKMLTMSPYSTSFHSGYCLQRRDTVLSGIHVRADGS